MQHCTLTGVWQPQGPERGGARLRDLCLSHCSCVVDHDGVRDRFSSAQESVSGSHASSTSSDPIRAAVRSASSSVVRLGLAHVKGLGGLFAALIKEVSTGTGFQRTNGTCKQVAFPMLEELDLTGTEVGADALFSLREDGAAPRLRALVLSECQQLASDGLRALGGMTQIEVRITSSLRTSSPSLTLTHTESRAVLLPAVGGRP